MANQHAKLGETHHLKNDARNQFGLFLKGIGAAACTLHVPCMHRACTLHAPHCMR